MEGKVLKPMDQKPGKETMSLLTSGYRRKVEV